MVATQINQSSTFEDFLNSGDYVLNGFGNNISGQNTVNIYNGASVSLSVVDKRYETLPGSCKPQHWSINVGKNAQFTLAGFDVAGNRADGQTELTINVGAGSTLTYTAEFAKQMSALQNQKINIFLGDGAVFDISGLPLVSTHDRITRNVIDFQNGSATLVIDPLLKNPFVPAGDWVKNIDILANYYTLSHFGPGDAIQFVGASPCDFTFAYDGPYGPRAVYHGPDGYDRVFVFTALTNPAARQLQAISVDGKTYIVDGPFFPCFLPGTMIRTPQGEVAVEQLVKGQNIIVIENGVECLRPVADIEKKDISIRADALNPEDICPIRVKANAISDGVPYKDLLLTPEHCLFLDSGFVPIRMLVNGRSIVSETGTVDFTAYHVELETHGVILANGTPSESYLRTEARRHFVQDGNIITLPSQPKTWQRDAAAPLVVDRERVEPIFRRFEARALAMGFDVCGHQVELTNDPDICLVTDSGRTLRPVRRNSAGEVFFMVPSKTRTVNILSRTARPTDIIGPFIDDRREFGVRVGRICMWEKNHITHIDTHLVTENLPGWEAGAVGSRSRRIHGNATLPLKDKQAPFALMLSLEVLESGPYRVEREVETTTPVPLSA